MTIEDHESQIDSLSARFEAAEIAVAYILAGIGPNPTQGALAGAQAAVARELSALLADVARWIEANVPRIYRRSAKDAAKSMVLRLPGGVFEERLREPIHTISLQSLADDLGSDMAKATTEMFEDAKKRLRAIGRNQQRLAAARSNPVARVPDFVAQMEEWDLRFTDRSGRRWKPARYARLCLVTQVGSVMNAASINTGIQFGSPGVRVFDGDYDAECRAAAGQAWSLGYAARNLLHHPNCKRSFAPLAPSWSGTLDRE